MGLPLRCATISALLLGLLGCGQQSTPMPPPVAGGTGGSAPLPGGGPPLPGGGPPLPGNNTTTLQAQAQPQPTAGTTQSNLSAPAGATVGGAPAGIPTASTVPAGSNPAAPGSQAPGAAGAGAAQPTTTQNAAAVVQSGDYAGLYGGLNTWYSQAGELKGVKLLDDKTPILGGYSWMVELLPYLGHNDIYQAFDFKKEWTDPANLQNTGKVIPAFLDPTNPQQHWKGFPFEGLGLTHFVGMSGIEDSRNDVAARFPRSDPRAGMFGYDQVARLHEITDGTSNTIMIIAAGRVVGPWVQGGGSTIRGAKKPYFDKLTGFGSASSPGSGAAVLFADGSVRTLSPDIDPEVFRALVTIHGAESIDMTQLKVIGQ